MPKVEQPRDRGQNIRRRIGSGTLGLGLTLVLVLALAASGCGGGGEKKMDSLAESSLRPSAAADIVVPAGNPIVIGVSVPLSGPDEAVGTEDRDAVVVGMQRWKAAHSSQIKGHDVEVRVEDDGCTEADITAQAANRLLRKEGLVGVVGPDCSAGAQAAIPVYAGAGIVAISGSATRIDLTTTQPEGRFFFRTAYRNDLQGTLIGLFASVQLKGKSAYVIDDGESYGQDLADAAQKAMEQSGVSVKRVSVKRGAVDFTDLATQIARDAPAFVGFAGFNPEAALLYRQLRDAGYKAPFGAGDAAVSIVDFVEPVGAEAAEGVVFSGCSPVLGQDFLADFARVHGSPPASSAFIAQYADAATILLDAVVRVAQEQVDGSLTIDPVALRDAVRASSLEHGISGPIAFDGNGDRVPRPGDDVERLTARAIATQSPDIFVDLGLVPCQVQDGKLVNLLGAGAGTLR